MNLHVLIINLAGEPLRATPAPEDQSSGEYLAKLSVPGLLAQEWYILAPFALTVQFAFDVILKGPSRQSREPSPVPELDRKEETTKIALENCENTAISVKTILFFPILASRKRKYETKIINDCKIDSF